jgi:hypothetical protein
MTVALVSAGCSETPVATYDQAFAADFAQRCEAGVGRATSQRACACWYERVSTEVPFDELPSLDELMAPDASEDVVDPVLYEELADCVGAFGAVEAAPVTAPPPLTIPPETTTTTAFVGEG